MVVGAGLSGLVAARELADRGVAALVLDKEPRPGGRLATRTVGPGRGDDGAQFFTVRDERFADLVERWRSGGCPITTWCHGFASAAAVGDGPGAADPGGDGYPRFVVAGGMDGLAAHLADDLDVLPGVVVQAVAREDGGWRLSARRRDGGETAVWRAASVLLTAPVPPSLDLLAAGDATLSASDAAALRRVRYAPCQSVVVALDRPPALPEPGGVQFTDGPVGWLGDNARKGVSDTPAVTVHAAEGWSAARLDDDPTDVVEALLALAAPWLGRAYPVAARLRRWRHSRPTVCHPEPVLVARPEGGDGPALAFAGDAFGSPRVEGAALSGLAAAEALTDPAAV
ncbi:hypothetical protein BH20ACT9_BH20ACT9_04320 [soil metagenome]